MREPWEIAVNLASLLSLAILAYVVSKPRVNRWAAVKCLRSFHEMTLDDLRAREQLRHLPWRRRVRQVWSRIVFPAVQRLMTREDRIRIQVLIGQLDRVEEHLTSRFAPPSGCDPLAVEAVYLSMRRSEKWRIRTLKRDHRGVLCAGGCGTRYGKRRSDHSLSGGGIASGWKCATNPCPDTSAPHYCGMCLWDMHWPGVEDADG